MRIISQGSLNAIGDFFISTHVMYNFSQQGHEAHIALTDAMNETTRGLYDRVKFFKSQEMIKEDEWQDFQGYCTKNEYTAHFYLKSISLEKGMKFFPLASWFDLTTCEKSVPFEKYAIVHVTSSSNYIRPAIPCLDKWVGYIEESGMVPVFIGTQKDEDTFKNTYPQVFEKYQDKECWRLGKDTIWQSIGNVAGASAAVVFSSWASIVAGLSGIYTIELWSHEQVLYYPSLVKYYLGSPVSLVQIPFTYDPLYNYFPTTLKAEMDIRSQAWLK